MKFETIALFIVLAACAFFVWIFQDVIFGINYH